MTALENRDCITEYEILKDPYAFFIDFSGDKRDPFSMKY